MVKPHSFFTEYDIHLFGEGKHYHLYEKFGAHLTQVDGTDGVYFAVWAPHARHVQVIGSFNHWNGASDSLNRRWDESGIWEGFIPGAKKGDLYKYEITTFHDSKIQKTDPYGKRFEVAPLTATVIWESNYAWKPNKFQKKLAQREEPQPYSVYEVHLGSWYKIKQAGNRSLTYREMSEKLVSYVTEMNFTHVEFMPVMEHPFYGSWGYQVTGFYAPSSRYGDPDDFKYLVECFHEAGIGVILDYVPSHFPGDAHGLFIFDGSHLYEASDPRRGYHPDWDSYIFDYGKPQVRSFLISSAIFWLAEYQVDGLRVDAVASMLYLDYSRKNGEWLPNKHGGNENLDAIKFLKALNEAVYGEFPEAVTIAEESTAWPKVSRPTYDGGLGFGQKWMMGWMHDTLKFMKRPPIYRPFHMDEVTFSMIYAFSENFMLPLSHDEVVHGKGSLYQRMPGDDWQKRANLRLMYGYMYTHPGTKLLFMGGEFGQHREWDHDRGLDWAIVNPSDHQAGPAIKNSTQFWIQDLNKRYATTPSLYGWGFQSKGFEWIDSSDHKNAVLIYLRKFENYPPVVIVCHFQLNVVERYRIGLPMSSAMQDQTGHWVEILNSDNQRYGGSGVINTAQKTADPIPYHSQSHSMEIRLAPMACQVWVWEAKE